MRNNSRAFTYLIIFVKHLGCEKSKLIADVLIKNGISVNDCNDHGHLPLCNAAKRVMSDAVDLLILLGADINKTDSKGLTALMHTILSLGEIMGAEKNQLDIITKLLKAGANTNTMVDYYGTPLIAAKRKKLSNVVLLLSNYGAI